MSMNNNWHIAASFRRDSSVVGKELPPGTLRRIVRFASPYRRQLVWFLLLVVLDAVIGAVNPLIFRAIIDDGIGHHRIGLTELLAGAIAVLALLDAADSLGNRWFSARIGEGLIYDMR